MLHSSYPVMLQTKTNPPASSENEVLRAHILDELPHVRDRIRIRLLSACAPAGFGKTALLHQWASFR
ncbi:hypothetical protein [Paenibacillus sp. MBLB4367]|uniref:hypothetical protein n=1 Tax=Paenibacillus sp. MBLB4367 TaxID=3384767 RepID=UPI003908330D